MAPTNKEPPKKWKPPKGPKPIQRKNKNTIGLGRSIANVRAKENRIEYLPDGEMRFTTDKHEAGWVKLRSVTQENALDEFLNTAQLADTDFTADRYNQVKIIKVDTSKNPYLLTADQEKMRNELHHANENKLKVPRRPAWDATTTKFQLDKQEREAFLEWRRDLAFLQENNDLLLTPFERNIEVWRQLWRVVERSDLVVQIVDARNPLLFRSPDLANYVLEVNPAKRNLLLVNKADLLTKKQRAAWAEYFKSQNIRYTFFSAFEANQLLEKLENGEEIVPNSKEQEDIDEATRILKIEELEELFMKEAPEPLTPSRDPTKPPVLQIGLVGYPNVGKSSTINALIGSKKVSVSSTPGKTKHFQTIHLSPEVLLCDCPGLVFPNFAYTNGELVCSGVLPIDQLREVTGPTQLVAQRIPKYYLEAVYGIAIPIKSVEDGGTGVPTSGELLTAYARARGYMTQGFGNADQPRAARYILKDYVNGRLPYVHPPPKADFTQISEAEKFEFNKELYTLNTLSDSRKEQILDAVHSKGLKVDEFDLSKDLSLLSFSSHVGGDEKTSAKSVNHGGKQAAMYNATEDLDREFFTMNNYKGTYSTPFHKIANNGSSSIPNNGKKHFKKNKKSLKKKGVEEY